MNTREFLKLVWPATGNFCIATPYINQLGKRVYRHFVHDNTNDAYLDARGKYQQDDVYFGIFSHLQLKVFNPTWNRDTPSRKRENMADGKTLFLDLDVGKSEPDKPKYPTRDAALASLAHFLFMTGLPDPIVVNSGYGAHAYWPFEDPISADVWRPYAQALRSLLDVHRILYDPSRTTDTTSVLRLPATLNHKNPDDLKPVQIIHEGSATPNADLFGLLKSLTAGAAPLRVAPAASVAGFSNIAPNVIGFPPTNADDVARECEQMRIFRDRLGNIHEGHWYAGLGVLGYCTDGEAVAQRWSAGHPNYTPEETKTKLEQWTANSSVTSCAKLGAAGVQGVCQTCPHFGGQHKNPIVITNKKPVTVALMPAQPVAAAVPFCPPPFCDPPYPYERITSLGVTRKDGKGMAIPVVFDYDLYPVSVSAGVIGGNKINTGMSSWVVRERDAKNKVHFQVIEIANGALADAAAMSAQFIPHSVFISFNPEVVKYMSAYLKQLKAHIGQRPQHAHLGWAGKDKINEFVLNGKVIDAAGNIDPCVMASSTQIATDGLTQGGTLQGQIDALKFYGHRNYRAHQFFVLASLCTPLFMATGHHGVCVNASGDSSAGKTTALKAASGMWGDPARFIVNGTARGMTPMARDARMAALLNLPTCVDEITHMDPENARTMVMTATHNRLRDVLNPDRSLKITNLSGWRSAPMLTTGNSSLHQVVNAESNTAGTANSARVMEIPFMISAQVHTKDEADALNQELSKHYGWVGERFMQLGMPSMEQLFASVHDMIARLNRDLNVTGMERFYIAMAAPVFVAGTFAVFHGLLDWDMDALYDWFINVQMGTMRTQLQDQASDIEYGNVLRDFIAAHILDTITDDGAGNIPPVAIRNQVTIHHRTDLGEMWVSRSVLRNWCSRRGSPFSTMLNALLADSVVLDADVIKRLGDGTRFATGRSRCVVINARHPTIDAK